MKKAQIAVETLLIYGLAILIVMLAVGALISFGVLDLGNLLPDRCELEGIAIDCTDYVVQPGEVRVQLQNSFGKNIYVHNITIVGEGDNTGLWRTSDNCRYNASPSLNPAGTVLGDTSQYLFVNGERVTFNFVDCGSSVPSGSSIEGRITMVYSIVGSDIEKSAFGTLRTKVS